MRPQNPIITLKLAKENAMTKDTQPIVVGVLALQGAFSEHIQLLRQAAESLSASEPFSTEWTFSEVRTPLQLSQCDALIIPGGESTTMSLVAASSNLLEPLREFVKYDHNQRFSRWQKHSLTLRCSPGR